MAVTTTSARQGGFEIRFWHRVFEEEVARVKGGFGPCNTSVTLSLLPPKRVTNISLLQVLRYILSRRDTVSGVRMVMFVYTSQLFRRSHPLCRIADVRLNSFDDDFFTAKPCTFALCRTR